MRSGNGYWPRAGAVLFFIATAATTTLVVVACANGTSSTADPGEGGTEEGGLRDVNVLPGKDSGKPLEDTGVPPEEDSGGSCTQKVVINEVMTRSASSAAVEFIELYNPNTCAVPLGDWDIGYKSAAGNGTGVVIKFAVGESILAKSFLLVGSDGFSATKDATFATGFSGMADDGQIALRDDTGTVIDSVGFGSATGVFVEKSAAPGPTTTSSVGRKSDGVDTDDNAADFKTSTPTPRAAN
jgi:hypothetical protein